MRNSISDEHTSSYTVESLAAMIPEALPGLPATYAPGETLSSFYLPIRDIEIVGRGHPGFALNELSVSQQHARFIYRDGRCTIEDLDSKNGTFVNEQRVTGLRMSADGDVVCLSKVLLVYRDDITPFRYQKGDDLWGMAGRFHTKKLVRDLQACIHLPNRGILLTGPTGTGKELAAKAVAAMLGRDIHIHNAARYTSEEEAAASLFGVKGRVFSNVDSREGYIAQAARGVLFLDEAHALTQRLQRSLLRIVEDNLLARIGEPQGRPVDVRFVFATNRPGPDYGLEPDFLARLTKVNLPPLKDRRVDIPHLFTHMLTRSLKNAGCPVEPTVSDITSVRYLALMRHGFEKDNVRGLIVVADNIASQIAIGEQSDMAIAVAFAKMMKQIGVSAKKTKIADTRKKTEGSRPREFSFSLLEEIHRVHGGNITAMEKNFRRLGFAISRRKLSEMVDNLCLPRVKKPRWRR